MNETYSELGATVTDDLDPNVTVSISGSVNTSVVGTYIITYTSTDQSGNTSSKERTINVLDTISPVVTLNGNSSITLDLGDTYTELGATATDNYDSTVNVVITGFVNTNIPGNYTIVYTAVDSSGNSQQVTRNITVLNNSINAIPVITILGDNPLIIPLGSNYNEPGASAIDSQGNTLSVLSENTVDINIIGDYSAIYTATDSYGNSATATREIRVRDLTAPVITLNGSSLVTLSLNDTYNELGATATDNVSQDLVVTITGTVNTSLPGTYTITYSTTDNAGNNSSETRTINVINDQLPTITLQGDNPLILDVGTNYSEPGATAVDSLGNSLTVNSVNDINKDVLGDYSVNYSTTDAYSNNQLATRTVYVRDRTAPILSLNGDNPLYVQYNSVYNEPGATVIDNYDNDITVSISGSVNTGQPGSYVRTYSATDDSGNNSSITRTVVVQNTELPTITLQGDNPYSLPLNTDYIEPGATAIDALDNVLSVSSSNNINKNILGSYTVTYTATDEFGNTASLTRTVNVLDIIKPNITLIGSNPLTIQLNQTYIEPGATVTDNYDQNISAVITGNVNTSLPGTYTRTYTATDNSGNSESITRTIIVQNNIDPIITISGLNPITLSVGIPYVDQGASAVDALGNTVPVTSTSNVNTDVIGSYQVIYNAVDSYGNTASSTRNVLVSDLDGPIISILGDNPMTVQLNEQFVDPGAVAFDEFSSLPNELTPEQESKTDGDLSNNNVPVVVVSNNVDTSVPGTYQVTYSATDSNNNTSVATRTVIVENNINPIITILGDNPLSITLGTTYNDSGASAVDALGNILTTSIISNNVNINVIGTYQVIYTATDSYSNTANATRTVNVVDLDAPVITILGDNPMTLQLNEVYKEDGATATDNYDSNVTVSISGLVNSSQPGVYTKTYTATDSSGNTGIATRVVNVENNNLPVINILGSSNVNLTVGQTYVDQGATAVDALGEFIIVTSTNNINKDVLGTYTVTYTASDDYNNTTTATRTVNVVDNIAPVITLNGINPMTLQINSTYTEPGATATDNYDGALTVNISGSVDTGIPGTYTITYSTVDSSGNLGSNNRTVIVQNNLPPTITIIGSNPLEININTVYNDLGATALDALENVLTVNTNNEVNTLLPGTYNVTYTATDAYGNTATSIRVVNVVDNDGPIIQLLGDNPLILQLNELYVEPGVIAIDEFSGTGSNELLEGDVIQPIEDGNVPVIVTGTINTSIPGTYTKTYTATDSNNNTSVATRTIQVQNNNDPIITLLGDTNMTLSVGTTFNDPGATAVDALGADVNVTVTSNNVNITVLGSYNVTYSATDIYGNTGTASRTVNIVDIDAPVITIVGNNPFTLQLNDTFNDPGATAVDNYDQSVNVTSSGSVNTGIPGTYTITYTSIDSSNNTGIAARTVVVENNNLPTITLDGPNPLVLQVNTTYLELGASAVDVFNNILNVNISGFVKSDVLGSYTITYSATDSYGNTATSTRTVNVVDTIAPFITLLGDNPLNLEVNSVFNDPGATAVDNYDNLINVTSTNDVNMSSIGSYSVVYSASDNSGNNSTLTRTVNVSDTTSPIITIQGNNPMILNLNDSFTDPGATATDNNDLTVTVTSTGTVNTSTPGTYTITYSATDTSGNNSTATRTVSVIDNIGPTINIIGDNPLILQLNDTFVDPGATATDDFSVPDNNEIPNEEGEAFEPTEGGSSNITVFATGTVNTALPGTYTRTYTATDSLNNTSTATRTVVVENNQPPVITINGSNPVNHQVNTVYNDQGATATDALGVNVTISLTGTVDSSLVGQYTLTYTATDAYGNTSTDSRVVNVLDEIDPVITLLGDNPMNISVNETFNDPGATATDNYDQTINVITSGSVNTSIIGTYTLTYTATDASGNFDGVTRTVNVLDLEAPIISLIGDNPLILQLNDTFNDPGATVTDNYDGTSNIVGVGTVNTSIPGSYTLTYNASDSSGNSNVITRTVQVQNNENPIITINGLNPIEHEVNTTYNDSGATAVDALGNDVNVVQSGEIDIKIIGNQTITYTATDSYGNTATSTRTVKVIDSTAPIITLAGDNPMNIEIYTVYQEPGATAVDNYDETVNVTTTGSVNTGIVGDYIVTYSATDSSGNTSTQTRTVSVIVTSDPVITLSGDNPFVLEYNTLYSEPGATAVDTIGNSVTVTSTNNIDNIKLGDYSVYYTATDSYGNTANTTRTIQVRDNIAPIITIIGDANISLQLNTPYSDAGATATDNRDNSVNVTSTGIVDTSTEGTYTITYTATDSSNNTSTATRTILVANFNPVITIIGDNPITHEVNTAFTDPGATAVDYDGNPINVNPQYPIIQEGVFTEILGQYSITYSAVDNGGRASLASRTINVIDSTAPVITITGNINDSVNLNDTYNDPGATATDNYDNTITVTSSGIVNTSIPGTYTITYSATDSSNNTSTAARNVQVINTTPPVITIIGDNPMFIPLNGTYNDPGASAIDNTGTTIIVNSSHNIDVSTYGSYTVTYTATDSYGNSAIDRRTVYITDFQAPTLTLIGNETINITQGSTFSDPGATATDVVDGNLTGNISVSGNVDTTTLGQYNLTYTVVDSEGRESQIIRTVNVIEPPDEPVTGNILEGGIPLTTNNFESNGCINISLSLPNPELTGYGGTNPINNRAIIIRNANNNGTPLRIFDNGVRSGINEYPNNVNLSGTIFDIEKSNLNYNLSIINSQGDLLEPQMLPGYNSDNWTDIVPTISETYYGGNWDILVIQGEWQYATIAAMRWNGDNNSWEWKRWSQNPVTNQTTGSVSGPGPHLLHSINVTYNNDCPIPEPIISGNAHIVEWAPNSSYTDTQDITVSLDTQDTVSWSLNNHNTAGVTSFTNNSSDLVITYTKGNVLGGGTNGVGLYVDYPFTFTASALINNETTYQYTINVTHRYINPIEDPPPPDGGGDDPVKDGNEIPPP